MTMSGRTYAVLLSGALLWCGAIVAAPVLAHSSPAFSSIIYHFFQPVCHQIDARCFHIDGAPFAVCFRCSSVYFAFLLSLLLYPLFRSLDSEVMPSRLWLLAAVLPMIVDVGLDVATIHLSTTVTRVATGCAFGLVLPWVICPAAMTGVQELVSSTRLRSQKGSVDA